MKRRSKIALAALGAVIAILLALQTPLLRGVRGAAWQMWLTVVTYVLPVGRLTVDNDVEQQLHQLTSENIRLKAEQQDYRQLREQLGSPSFASYRVIPAEVAARPIDTFGVAFTINRGAKDGVTLQAPVVVYGSTLVGFVTQLYEHSAVVQLLLHPSTNLSVEIVGEGNARGLLVGQRYTSLALTTVPRDAQLQDGQDVVTVAREGLPHGLRVGTIGTALREENQAYQEATITLPYDPDTLRVINVIVEP